LFEYAEARDIVEDTELCLLCFREELPMLLELPCVAVLLCPKDAASGKGEGGFDELEVLGLQSARPSKGPGAMLSILFVMLSPPSNLGLSGAKRGLGGAYNCCGAGSNLSRCCGRALWGVALLLDGNGGNAQSKLDIVGEGGAIRGRGNTGVVALLFILKGDFGGVGDIIGDRLLGSL
jgi:hypothetical protein